MTNRLKGALAAFAVAGAITSAANAVTIANWGFETVTPPDVTDSTTYTGVLPDAGAGVVSGVHAGSATDWSTPSGPGSANAFSSNTWAVGDYYQAVVSTVGLEDVVVNFDATGSNTGPRDFKIAYATSLAGPFTDFGTYSLVNIAWANAVDYVNPANGHFTFDFSAVPALDEQATVVFRLIDTSTTSINAGTVAAGGTSRFDNFVVTANPVPEPTTLGLLGLGALALGARRRVR